MMKINTFKRGFTLIELLVVIAIIGILASVVLASLNTARSKGSDAAVKSNVNGIRVGAEVVYDNLANRYSSVADAYSAACGAIAIATPATFVFNDSNVQAQVDGAVTAGGLESKCAYGATFYVIAVPLKSTPTQAWCVDSTGAATTITFANFTAATDVTCALAGT